MSLRSISLRLFANTGTEEIGDSITLTGKIVKAGTLQHSVDAQLTKITPGDVSFEVEDFDEAVWTFCQEKLAANDGFRPAFAILETDEASTRRFAGIVDPSRITRDQAERTVSIAAQDWSVMLANQPLADWSRPLPKATSEKPQETGKSGQSPYKEELTIKQQHLSSVLFEVPNNWLGAGDRVTVAPDPGYSGGPSATGEFKVLELNDPPKWGSYTGWFEAVLSAPIWPTTAFEGLARHCLVTRLGTATGETNYYTTTADVDPQGNADEKVYAIPLDTVDGIVPGDKLKLILSPQSTSYTVMNVDAERKEVITKEPVSRIVNGDRLFWDTESSLEVVYEDARAILSRAVLPYSIDLSRWAPAILPDPVLAWLPLRPSAGEDLRSIADVEPGLSDYRVIGSDAAAWDGDPETGWESAVGGDKRVIWTDQTTTAPASLMTDETATVAPKARRRNRAYDSFDFRDVDNGDGDWTPTGAETASKVVVHDYLMSRRLVMTGKAIEISAWSGSWGAPSSTTWPGSGTPQSACVFPGLPGAILAITESGLELAWGPGGTVSLAVTDTEALKGVLATTPWGAYLVGPTGYGRVDYTGSGLTLRWVTLGSEVSTFWPNTFAALDQNEVVIMGRLEALDRATSDTLTETWLFRLSALPVEGDAAASVLWSEQITDGTPRLVGAFRDPKKVGRVIGQMGGRLWQVDRQLPPTIERFKPSVMTSAECIEHVCQVHNLVAIPQPDGTLAVVSRVLTDDVYSVTVDQVRIEETRAWEHFYSICRVSSADDKQWFDAEGTEGGRLLEVSKHPMIWTRSHAAGVAKALALWFGTPRNVQVQTWFHENAATAPPWESLPKLARIKINDGEQEWLVMGVSEDLVNGESRVTLLEIDRPGYGLAYGMGGD